MEALEEALEEGEEDKLYVPAENNVTENTNLPIEKIQNYFEDLVLHIHRLLVFENL